MYNIGDFAIIKKNCVEKNFTLQKNKSVVK